MLCVCGDSEAELSCCVYIHTIARSFRVSVRIPVKPDGWLSSRLNLRRPPQIPEFAQNATWPTCDAGPGPTAKTPFGKNRKRATVPGAPKRTRWRQGSRGPQQKQVSLGEQTAFGVGFVSTCKFFTFTHVFSKCISFSPHLRPTSLTVTQSCTTKWLFDVNIDFSKILVCI